jgi:parvulin-like peptidyl-prolyl isomerase
LRKNAFTIAAAAALFASVLGLAGCGGGATTKGADDDVAATVNGVAIPVSKVDQQIDQQIKQAGPQAQQLTPVALAAARLQILDQLIQEEALYQRAQKENVIPTDDEVKQALQTQIQQSGMSQDEYQKRLQDLGQTEDQLKDEIKRQLAIQKLQDKVTATIPAPTEAEMQKFFDENRAQLVAPRGLDLSDIIVDPQQNPGVSDDAVGVDAAAKKAQDVSTQLKNKTDFATVARARSEDQSALQGGSIGFFADDRLKQTFPPDVLQKIVVLQVGQNTDPIQSQDGRWHIFKLNARRDQAQDMTYDQVKQQIAQNITDQRKQVVLSALVREAMTSATIRNNLATQIIEHPDTFGALRPSPLTQPGTNQPVQQPQAQPQPQPQASKPEAQPGGPVKAPPTNKNAAPATKK